MRGQRTYWHLEGAGRVPTDYDIVTSRLLYYRGRGFEVRTPVADWYQRYQSDSPLALAGLARFRDPRATTYAKYVALASEREGFVDGLLRAADQTGSDQRLSAEWVTSLGRWLPVLLYPCHGLQMVAAYVGQLAPTSEAVVAFAFQAGDEMRRIQRLAYRVKQLGARDPGFSRGKEAWEQASEWQPLRRVIEELLVSYDFGTALVTLGLVVKPAFDTFFMEHAARLAEARGDNLLSRLLFSLAEDCQWHASFTNELVRCLLADSPENLAFVTRVVNERKGPMLAALGALEPLWDPGLEPFSAVMQAFEAGLVKRWRALGLEALS